MSVLCLGVGAEGPHSGLAMSSELQHISLQNRFLIFRSLFSDTCFSCGSGCQGSLAKGRDSCDQYAYQGGRALDLHTFLFTQHLPRDIP